MKIKNLLALTAMAAMAFTACNKDENGAGVSDNTPKSVTLSLKNVVPGTRADLPVGAQTKVTVNDLQVFFVSGNTLVQGKTVDNQAAEHYFDFTDEGFTKLENQVFHFLPSNVTKVIVIGNLGAKSEAATVGDLKQSLAIADEQDDANLSLYAEAELDKITGTDDKGHPLYEVSVSLVPRVSRIEVASFKYNAVLDEDGQTELPRDYTSIAVKQVVLNNYYETAKFADGAVIGAIKSEPIDDEKAAEFFLNAAKQQDGVGFWYNDTIDPAIDLNAAASYAKTYADGEARPAYHFFPNATNIGTTAQPQLAVQLIGTKADGTQVPLYLLTSRFTTNGEPAITNEFAKIYRVSFAFNDNDLKQELKCVDVTVDVVAWEVKEVNAEF
ncbi:MAG: hypothetical protein ACLSVO_00315 [Alistipes sp.]|jgi:hypothetical protein|uniref:hypothetical protein n=2 Tax=Rikenellaceae TaxID=171550 RepID=UPI001D7CD61E|nr:hypothetical protein [Alistipes sp.]MBS6099593.1 hypothetical protein [Alistipes sp.]